jgi:hypothetical protein
MRFVLFFIASLCATCAHGQALTPYPSSKITAAQWQAYFEEVSSKHAADRREFPNEHLVVFEDQNTHTIYAFTAPGHPAHPAWVTRVPVQDSKGLHIREVGYFAGDEAPFAALFQEYVKIDEMAAQQLKAGNPQSK